MSLHSSRKEINKAREAAEIDYCMEKYRAGYSQRDISKLYEAEFGTKMSQTTVSRRIEAGVKMIVVPAVEEYRKVELERLNELQQKNAAKVDAGDAQAIANAIRISDRRSKLLGLDAPQQVQAIVATVDISQTPFGQLMAQRMVEQKQLEAQLAEEDEEE